MAKIYKSVTDLIGNTPLLEISKYSKSQNVEAKILAKLESFNPGGSVKDRIGYAMIKDAEDKGLIHKDSVIIEPTSGNTGIGLAMAATSLGYPLIIVLPDTFSIERRKVMAALGAKLVLTPGAEGMSGALKRQRNWQRKFQMLSFHNNSATQLTLKFTERQLQRKFGGILMEM